MIFTQMIVFEQTPIKINFIFFSELFFKHSHKNFGLLSKMDLLLYKILRTISIFVLIFVSTLGIVYLLAQTFQVINDVKLSDESQAEIGIIYFCLLIFVVAYQYYAQKYRSGIEIVYSVWLSSAEMIAQNNRWVIQFPASQTDWYNMEESDRRRLLSDVSEYSHASIFIIMEFISMCFFYGFTWLLMSFALDHQRFILFNGSIGCFLFFMFAYDVLIFPCFLLIKGQMTQNNYSSLSNDV